MLERWRRRLFPDPILGILGLAVFIASLTVYLRTVQRTVSFWDCGEFLACSYTLGIPHPPGSPLHVLLARLASLVPTAHDLCYRMNLLSPLWSALTAALAFYVLARLITSWYADDYPGPNLTLAQRLSVYAGSCSGALIFAFSDTNWSNSVEAEVYALAMLLMVALIWLTLVWVQRRDTPGSDRYLVAIAYISFLSIAVHLTVFLVMPPIFLAVVLLSERHRRDWRFWLTGIVLFLVAGDILTFFTAVSLALVLAGVLGGYRRWGRAGSAWSVAALAAGGVWTLLQGEVWPLFLVALLWSLLVVRWVALDPAWGLSFALLVASLLGWSIYLSVPVRSGENPTINESAPSTWSGFTGYLERKQYGSEPMVLRALHRRAQWINQLGRHARMGFWGFFEKQYGFNRLGFLPVFALGLAGVYELTRRRRAIGLFIVACLLVTSLGLIWYMNFADGTRYNAATQDAYLEVRDRDYFFTPFFILFGMAIGLGGAVLVGAVGQSGVVWPALTAVLVSLLPIRAVQANYFTNDRSRNFLACDYAFNLLASADQGAVLFTNGDNDTFPVWCLQEVEGVRRDVRIVNLSLGNTNWYIKQLKHFHNVPIDMSDETIEHLVHYRTPDGKVHRLQDQLVDEILTANKGRQPINFAVTVGASARRYHDESIEKHMVMTGLAYRLVPEEGEGLVELDTLRNRLDHVFRFRGVNDPLIYKDDNAERTISGYGSAFLLAADTLRRAGRFDETETYVRRLMELTPQAWEPYVYLAQLFADTKRPDQLESLLVQASSLENERERSEVNVAYSLYRLGQRGRAEEILRTVLARSPDYDAAFKVLAQVYYENREYDSLLVMLRTWVRDHPNDDQMKKLLTQMTTPPGSAGHPDTGARGAP